MPKLTLKERAAELAEQIQTQQANLIAAQGAMQMLNILIAAEQEPAVSPTDPDLLATLTTA